MRVGLRKPRAGYAALRGWCDAWIAEALYSCAFFFRAGRGAGVFERIQDPLHAVGAQTHTLKFSTLLLRRRRGRVALGLQDHGAVDLGDVRQSPQDFNFGLCGFQPFVHGVAY